ncbi:MAG: hypothetical protein KDA98_03545 [Acidimicrobiales bacterium]|nr:hypothetical protein [Acidimicrobiales bacterium]
MTAERRRRWSAAAVAALALLAACTSDPPSPEEEREARIRDRLDETFSRAQVDCIVDQLDEPARTALDGEGALDADSEELAAYSLVLVDCVTVDTDTD